MCSQWQTRSRSVGAYILGIESSCDETAAAIVSCEGHVVSSVVATQFEAHRAFGGVVPELAAREHLRLISGTVRRALDDADVPIAAVAATLGPGLSGALLVGSQFAKGFAWSRQLPFVGVDHLQAHLLAPFLFRDGEENAFSHGAGPYVALLVSGGHTALYLVRDVEDGSGTCGPELLGQTRDDAAGEALDKAAKLLGLAYPGGPEVDRLAQQGRRDAIDFPRAFLHGKDHLATSFSFSGLKTALVRHLEQSARPPREDGTLADVCASYLAAVVDVLVNKALRACVKHGVDTLVMAGGVAASRVLRATATERAREYGIRLVYPPAEFCTDNGAMVAYAGARRFVMGEEDALATSHYSRSPERIRGRFHRDGSQIARERR